MNLKLVCLFVAMLVCINPLPTLAEDYGILKPKYTVKTRKLDHDSIKTIEASIGYVFKNKALLRTAFTPEGRNKDDNYEILEFFGDKVLEFYLTPILMKYCPKEGPGHLTSARQALVSKEQLGALGLRLGFYDFIQVLDGEVTISNLEDVIEALIGAIYEDGKETSASEFVIRHFVPMMNGGCPWAEIDIMRHAEGETRKKFKYAVLADETVKITAVAPKLAPKAPKQSARLSTKKITGNAKRIAIYLAERKFIQNLPQPFPTQLVLLPIDPGYKPLDVSIEPASQDNEPPLKEPSREDLMPVSDPSIEALATDIPQPQANEMQPVSASLELPKLRWDNDLVMDPLKALNEVIAKLGIDKSVFCSQEEQVFDCSIEVKGFGTFNGKDLTKKKAERIAAQRAYLEIQLGTLLGDDYAKNLDKIEPRLRHISNVDDMNPISFVNEFCQQYDLESPTYQSFVKDSDGKPSFYTRVNASWLFFPLESEPFATVGESRIGAASRIMFFLKHFSIYNLTPRKLEEFVKHKLLSGRKNEKNYLQALSTYLDLTPSYKTKVISGPITAEGVQFRSKLTFSRLGAPLYSYSGEAQSSKADAEGSAAAIALPRLANEVLKLEIPGF